MRTSTARPAQLLQALANLGDSPAEAERFWTRFQGLFPREAFRLFEQVEEGYRNAPLASAGGPMWLSPGEPLTFERKTALRRENLLQMRNWLREAWAIGDPARKSWKVFLLRMKFHQLSVGREEQMEEPPPDCGIDRALRFLLNAAYRARVCGNPDCPTPYFIAGQWNRRFCSAACARAEQQRYKQRWWQEHADVFRLRRTKAKRSRSESRV